MTQPNLLERAQQGDPDAIAALMNQTLEPQGVTAKAVLEADCLHVFLSAPRMLNAKTLVTFTQRGILSLSVQSLQQVRIYGKLLGDDHPAWVEAFPVPRSETVAEVEQVVDAFVPAALPQKRSYLSNMFVAAKRLVAQRAKLSSHASQESSKQEGSGVSPAESHRPVHYLKMSLAVILVAFATGGVAAFIANSSTLGGAVLQVGKKTTIAVPESQMALRAATDRAHEQQEATARTYLETMNQTQQAFYSQNSRFAANLEELERSATVSIASHSNYTYKLTLHHNTQAQLTAIPNADGLKSYTAVVTLAPATKQIVTAICASQQPAKVPPLVFQSTSGLIQCPEEPANAS